MMRDNDMEGWKEEKGTVLLKEKNNATERHK